jgi:CRISPR/Cas system-associated exonuclease Cas4 (RecB family)
MGLEFVEEEKLVQLNTVSNSLFKTFALCKLKAWYEKRMGVKEKKLSDSLKLVRYIKDLFSAEIASIIGEKYKVNKRGLKPETIYEGDMLMRRLNLASIVGDGQIAEYDMLSNVILSNGLNLFGSISLLMLKKDPNYGNYMQVFLLKTGFRVEKEVDTEAIIYTYLIGKKYGLPVLFTRYSARSSDAWEQFFTNEDALALEDSLTSYSSYVRDTIESEELPEISCGGHCTDCPFIKDCAASKLEEIELSDILSKYQWATAYAKHLKDKVQGFVAEREEPLDVKGYSVTMKESVSKTVKTKGINKADLLVLFAKSGKLNLILDSMELKITDNLIDRAKEEFGIEFKDSTRRSLMIEASVGDPSEEGEKNE